MLKHSESIKIELRRNFNASAREYLSVGLSLFHSELNKTTPRIQATIGILSIGVELALKAFVASRNPLLVLKTPSHGLRVLFSCPETLPDDFNWRSHDIDLRSFDHETIDLNECISFFYTFYPKQQSSLKPYLKVLAEFRNKCVHSSLPTYHKYELERTVYLTLNLLTVLVGAKTFYYTLTKDDKDFLASYKAEQNDKVKKKILDAKRRAKELQHKTAEAILSDSWYSYIIQCPICQSDAVLSGSTIGPKRHLEYLEFEAEDFTCDKCGLVLADAEELELAGVDIYYDRSDELDRWNEEKGREDEWL
jgi:transcription elongation factor Elf1